MNFSPCLIYKIHFIDQRTGQKESIVTDLFTWNADYTILNISVKLPTREGIKHQDLQLSRKNYLSMEIHVPLLLKNGLIAEAEFNLKWNERNMELDPEFRKDVYRTIKWIKMYKLKDIDERWLDEMANITEKKYKDKYGKLKPDW